MAIKACFGLFTSVYFQYTEKVKKKKKKKAQISVRYFWSFINIEAKHKTTDKLTKQVLFVHFCVFSKVSDVLYVSHVNMN